MATEILEICDKGFEEFWVKFVADFPSLEKDKKSYWIAYRAGFLHSSDYLITKFSERLNPVLLGAELLKDLTEKQK